MKTFRQKAEWSNVDRKQSGVLKTVSRVEYCRMEQSGVLRTEMEWNVIDSK